MKRLYTLFTVALLILSSGIVRAADYSTAGYKEITKDQTLNASSGNNKFLVPEGSSVSLNINTSNIDTVYVIAEGTINFGWLSGDVPLKLIIGEKGSVNYSTVTNYKSSSYTTNYSNSFTFSSVNSTSTLVNDATISIPNGIQINGNGAKLINYGSLSINGSLSNSGEFDNNGPTTITGSLENNSGDMENNCSINISGDFTSSGTFVMGDGAYVEVLKTATFSGGSGNFGPGAYFKTSSLTTSYITIEGPSNGQAVIQCFPNPSKNGPFSHDNLYVLNGSNEIVTGYSYYPKGFTTSGTPDFSFAASQCSPGFDVQPDADKDGVPDDQDAFPNDSTRASITYYPNSTTWGTLMFEDNWPSKGDYDFNDLVLNYQYAVITSAKGKIVDLTLDYQIKALGALNKNGFGFSLPIANNLIESVTGTDPDNSTVTLQTNGTEQTADANEANVIVCDNLSRYGSMVNVYKDNTNNTTGIIKEFQLTVNFVTNNGLSYDDLINSDGKKGINPFIYVAQTRGREVHLPGYQPTSKADNSYFQTADDNTVPGQSTYKTSKGLPWALDVPQKINYMLETIDITNGYKNFASWTESGGTTNPDWYNDGTSSTFY